LYEHYGALLFGIACAAIGGELFVRGSVGLASWARISPGIVAATVAAFATSSPEMSVAISSAVVGKPQIALGDALGSNVVNVALILGAALVIAGIQTPRAGLKRDFPVALLIPVISGALLLDGELSRVDGGLMLCAFFAWLVATIVEARRQRSAAEQVLGTHRLGHAVAYCFLGLMLLMAAGYLIVNGARGIAVQFGIGEFVIGATVVAVGTSVPELATAIVAKLRGHDEVGLGTILGSNIFNGLFVVALAATIHPITVDWRAVFVALIFGLVALACAYPMRDGFIERRRGFFLLAIYIAYITTVLQLAAGAASL
jgi:cation:H+ antiporter